MKYRNKERVQLGLLEKPVNHDPGTRGLHERNVWWLGERRKAQVGGCCRGDSRGGVSQNEGRGTEGRMEDISRFGLTSLGGGWYEGSRGDFLLVPGLRTWRSLLQGSHRREDQGGRCSRGRALPCRILTSCPSCFRPLLSLLLSGSSSFPSLVSGPLPSPFTLSCAIRSCDYFPSRQPPIHLPSLGLSS